MAVPATTRATQRLRRGIALINTDTGHHGRVMAGAPRGFAVLGIVCLLAFAARVVLLLFVPNVIHADEMMQYSEQAFRAVNGHGLVPWEYRVGIRSWVIPGMLIPWMQFAKLVGADPETIRIGVGVMASALSALVVGAAYLLGERAVRGGGLWAAAINAFWPESMIYGPHILADTVVIVPLICALAMVARPEPGRSRLIAAGFLSALATLLRPQLAPAIAIAFFWIGGLEWRRYLAMAIGGLPAILLFGLVDFVTWGVPFQSVFRYIRLNQAGIAAIFGEFPADSYLRWEVGRWSVVGVALVLGAAALGARCAPMLAVMALAIVVTFSAFAHKEMRFVYPAVPLIMTLAGIGTAVAIEWWRGRSGSGQSARFAGALAALWAIVFAISAVQRDTRTMLVDGMGAQHALQAANADPRICGMAVVPEYRWYATGYARVRSDIDLYRAGTPERRGPRSYNALIVFENEGPHPDPTQDGFARSACFRGGGTVCLYRRQTPCSAGVDAPMIAGWGLPVDRILRREGFTP